MTIPVHGHDSRTCSKQCLETLFSLHIVTADDIKSAGCSFLLSSHFLRRKIQEEKKTLNSAVSQECVLCYGVLGAGTSTSWMDTLCTLKKRRLRAQTPGTLLCRKNVYCDTVCLDQAHLPRGWKQPGAEMLRNLRVPKQIYRQEKPPPSKVSRERPVWVGPVLNANRSQNNNEHAPPPYEEAALLSLSRGVGDDFPSSLSRISCNLITAWRPLRMSSARYLRLSASLARKVAK